MKTFFLHGDNILINSQHLLKFSAYKHSSSMGLNNGSADDSSNINNASAVVCGVPTVFFFFLLKIQKKLIISAKRKTKQKNCLTHQNHYYPKYLTYLVYH